MKKLMISLFFLLYLIRSGLGQDVSFSGHFLYQSPSSKVFSVTTGDLDMDTYPDILFTEPDGNLLQWFRNENNGQFSLEEIRAFSAIGAIAVDVKREPATGNIVIHFGNNQSGQYQVELVDTLGRIYFSAISGTSGIVIPANKVKSGIYLLRVVSSGKQFVMKIYTE